MECLLDFDVILYEFKLTYFLSGHHASGAAGGN